MISYAYSVLDIFKSRSRKFVEESFESLSGQSNDIMVMDYDSKDDIEEVVKSYGFKFYRIPKTPNFYFHVSKMTNNAIFKAINNLFFRVTVDIIYPKNLSKFIEEWHLKSEKNKCLVIQAKKNNSNFKSPMSVFKRDLLLQTKGIDERITFYGAEHKYLRKVYLNEFKLEPVYVYEPLKVWHRPHKKGYSININDQKQKDMRHWTNNRILQLKNNFNIEIKKAMNSFWGNKKYNKIFCIGLGKTGTVSLTRALEKLGFKIALYPSGNAFYQQIDDSDGASDLSISCRFEELDTKYPNSKFICPVRDIKSWLVSCSKQYKEHQRENVLGTKYRNLMFGTDIYNREKFVDAYFRNDKKITKYFENRENDILYINIIKGEGYKKLCSFLGLDVLDDKFPHEHKT